MREDLTHPWRLPGGEFGRRRVGGDRGNDVVLLTAISLKWSTCGAGAVTYGACWIPACAAMTARWKADTVSLFLVSPLRENGVIRPISQGNSFYCRFPSFAVSLYHENNVGGRVKG